MIAAPTKREAAEAFILEQLSDGKAHERNESPPRPRSSSTWAPGRSPSPS